ncbi:unnamed protein product [Polarella glacialis]|uniref:Sulfate transporter n=1 Tax=Polarella glacialis TaxID=89957 RepID=A0A813DEA5_POLGL|nr:unnamed protein product [Polarella glacialis]CAE8659940.1 unnamed protein product [Polarella glacialis]
MGKLDLPLLHVEESENKSLTRFRCEGGDFLAPFVAVALSLPVTIGAVGVAVAGNDDLKPFFCVLLSQGLLSLAMSAFCYSRYSQFPTCSNVDFLTAAFFGRFANLMHGRVPSHLLLVHMLVAQGLFTMLVGLVSWAIASLDILWVMRFLPYPVITGFNCAGALMIMNGGLSLGTGKNLVQFLGHATWIIDPMTPTPSWGNEYAKFAATLLGAAVFYGLGRTKVNGAAKLPIGFGIVSACFYAFTKWCGITHAELELRGFFLENISGDPWYAGFVELAGKGSQINWWFWVETEVLMLVLPYTVLISFSLILFLANLHEVLPPHVAEGARYNFTEEIRTQGKFNVFVGLFCGIPMCSSLKFWLVIKQAGSKTRIWVLNMGVALLMLFICPDLRLCLSVVPKCAFSGLVVCIGLDFFVNMFTESRRRIAASEWRFAAVTTVVTFFNIFAGLLLGILLAAFFFLVEYSSMTGIIRKATLADVRSFAVQTPEHATLLHKRGGDVAVFWCSGYIFFGTASTIVQDIDDYLDTFPNVQAIILDFEFVPAVDASGVSALMGFASRCLKKSPPVSVCCCGMTRRLHGSMTVAVKEWKLEDERVMLNQRRIEGALGWAEQLLIKAYFHESPANLSRASSNPHPVPFTGTETASKAMLFLLHGLVPDAVEGDIEAFVQQLAPSLEIVQYKVGGTLFREGAGAKSLHFVLSGSVKLSKVISETEVFKMGRYHLNEEKGDKFVFEQRTEVELKCVPAGGWLGSLEFCATASMSRTPCCVVSARAGEQGACSLRVPFHCLRDAKHEHPAVWCAVLEHVSFLAGLESLELLGSTRMLPYRTSSDATFLACAEASPTGGPAAAPVGQSAIPYEL